MLYNNSYKLNLTITINNNSMNKNEMITSKVKNWKTRGQPYIKEDTHRAEVIDLRTGEVIQENLTYNELEETNNQIIKHYKSTDCFSKTNWAKHG